MKEQCSANKIFTREDCCTNMNKTTHYRKFDSRNEKKRRKIVIIGSPKCGKSALVERFLNNSYCDIPHNKKLKRGNEDYYYKGYSLNIELVVVSENESTESKVFHIKTADAIMLVYEFASLNSVEDLLQSYKAIRTVREDKMPVLIVSTKIDKNGGSSPQLHLRENESITSVLYAVRGAKQIYTSAKYNINIRDAFEMCFDDIIKRIHTWSMSAQQYSSMDERMRNRLALSEEPNKLFLFRRFLSMCNVKKRENDSKV
ncbi:uncharacterized protein LOC105843855 [Hydra vulgaris]|uniref:Uncharacterized protein LOC105843855 n=1 Tax=Hydra vulgaris TaxID=6087 RepID=A0ABM4CBQ0_HYDVU